MPTSGSMVEVKEAAHGEWRAAPLGDEEDMDVMLSFELL
jgi:hypothetical protein